MPRKEPTIQSQGQKEICYHQVVKKTGFKLSEEQNTTHLNWVIKC